MHRVYESWPAHLFLRNTITDMIFIAGYIALFVLVTIGFSDSNWTILFLSSVIGPVLAVWHLIYARMRTFTKTSDKILRLVLLFIDVSILVAAIAFLYLLFSLRGATFG